MSNYQDCIDACQRCAIACERCLIAMIDMDSDNDCPHCCRECIDISLLCSQAMARDSRFAEAICKLCADVCQWCAEQCEAHAHDHCQACVKACRECIETCHSMAA